MKSPAALAVTLLLVGGRAHAEEVDPCEPEPYPRSQLHGRVLAGFEAERRRDPALPGADATEPGFFLQQARLALQAEVATDVKAKLSADLEAPALRDAYLNLEVHKAFQARLGRMRRPLSRLNNRGRGMLPFRSRGLYDKLILEDQAFGDRTLGLVLWGKPVKRLRYYAAVMDPAAAGSGIEGADAIARVTFDPWKPVSFGLAGMHKWTERWKDGPNLRLLAASVDAQVSKGALYAAVEANAAQNPNPPALPMSTAPRTPWALGVIAYGSYAFALRYELSLSPVLAAEWMDTDTGYSQDERVRGLAGLVLGYRESLLRVMPQVEIVRPIGKTTARSELPAETYYVLVSGAF